MPQLHLKFIPSDKASTDEQLLLQLVYGLCGQINIISQEYCRAFVSAVGVPNPDIRRLAKLLVSKLGLPIPAERVDEWIDWQRRNGCWVVDEDAARECKRLTSLTK